MNIEVRKTTIETAKVTKELKILHLADIHYEKTFSRKKLMCLSDSILKRKPDIVVITGDMLDENSVVKTAKIADFYEFLKILAKKASVYIVLGNHDVSMAQGKKHKFFYPKDFVAALKSLKNVHYLENSYVIDDIFIFGYLPPTKYYALREKSPQLVKEDFQKIIFPKTSKFAILLTHSPLAFMDFTLLDDTSFDLLLAGHTHNGMLPLNLPGNFGLIAPYKTLFPKKIRGILRNHEKMIIINGGVTKLSKKTKFLHYLNFLFPVSLDEIIIKPIKIKEND